MNEIILDQHQLLESCCLLKDGGVVRRHFCWRKHLKLRSDYHFCRGDHQGAARFYALLHNPAARRDYAAALNSLDARTKDPVSINQTVIRREF